MPTDARLIVGLGNPGPKYQNNRHNIGFMVLDELARQLEISFHLMEPGYLLATGSHGAGLEVHLIKPLTYMNLSGEALLQWSRDHQRDLSGLPPVAEPDLQDLPGEILRPLVICDEIALPLGSLRLRASGSSGGQNGLGSIIGCLGGDFVPRMRLGVAGGSGKIPPEVWADYVLADFPSTEAEKANDLVNHAVAGTKMWLDEGFDQAVSRFNRRVKVENPDSV
jgi:peptidyl-tRNA hydrolase, PTH1 family